MDISLEQIHEFNKCPMIYKFKYLMRIDRTQISLEQEYHDAVRKAIMFFYYQILNGNVPTIDQLRQKFGSIFYRNMSTQDILTMSTLDKNLNALNLNGIKTLTAFYEREAKKEFIPIVVDTDLKVPIGNNHILFTMDLVREVKVPQPVIEVVKFTSTTRKVDTFYVNHDTMMTLQSYAFRKLFQSREDRLVLQHMKLNKEFFTIRKDPEFRRLEAMVNGICNSIQRQEFYPVHNMQCNSCIYRDVCDKYKF